MSGGKLSKDILLDDRTELFRSGDPQGEYGFRGAICNYLYQARGVDCSPEQIVIGAGSDYILILLSMILGKEHTIAFEDPTYKQAYRVIQTLGYETVPVTMDHNGMRISELEDSEADIAYVTPSHQYPTGIVMPIKRRMELLKWAYGKEGRYIIEDDYDSEFRYKGKPIPALQGYDAEDKVIYLGTFFKIHCTGYSSGLYGTAEISPGCVSDKCELYQLNRFKGRSDDRTTFYRRWILRTSFE